MKKKNEIRVGKKIAVNIYQEISIDASQNNLPLFRILYKILHDVF